MRAGLAVVLLLGLISALAALQGCARAGADERPAADATYADPDGDGVLAREGPAEPLRDRTDLAPAARPGRELARFAQISDAHVQDEETPAQLKVLDRFGVSGSFRPQEALAPQVLGEAVRAVNAFRPEAVVVTGDLIQSAQVNELDQALATLAGGTVRPDSGASGYSGPQAGSNPDPLFYRPDVDAPRFPGLMGRAQEAFTSPGLRAPWFPTVGNHDLLVQGEVMPSGRTRALATGTRALAELDPNERLPDGVEADNVDELLAGGDAEGVEELLDRELPGRTRRVAADPRRRHLSAAELMERLRAASAHGPRGAALFDYAFQLAPGVRGLALDTARRDGGPGGVFRPEQERWLARELGRARREGEWVLVFSHHPLERAEGGARALALLDREPRVVAAVNGHMHRNSIRPRRSQSGGYWLVTTASLIEHPQQARAFRLVETAGGGVALETWAIDHSGAGKSPAGIARQLAFLDVHGGRPAGSAGSRLDRNVRLFR